MSDESDMKLLGKAKMLARQCRHLTGRPLGITGEVAEYEAARVVGLKLAPARQAGYDATEERDGDCRRIQIKGRCLLENSKPGQQLGSISLEHQWDAVLLVLMDQNLDVFEIYEADRPMVKAALTSPGSKARNERGSLRISKFKAIGRKRWQRGRV